MPNNVLSHVNNFDFTGRIVSRLRRDNLSRKTGTCPVKREVVPLCGKNHMVEFVELASFG